MLGIVIIFMYGFGTFLAYVIGAPLLRLILGKDGYKRATERAMERKYGLTPEQKAFLEDSRKDIARITRNMEFTQKFMEEDKRKREEQHRRTIEESKRLIARHEARHAAEEAQSENTDN